MSGRRSTGRARHHVAAWLGWWALSMVLWLLFTSTVDWQEVVTGVGCAAVAATAVEVVRAKRAFDFRPRLRMIAPLWRLPVQIAVDTRTVFSVLINHVTGRRQVRGTWRAVELRHGAENNAEDTARRALGTLAASIAPNSFAVGIDPERDELLVHQLRASPGDVEKLIAPT